MDRKILLRGGKTWIEGRFVEADVLIEGEKIAGVGKYSSRGNVDVVNVKGLYILPGLIDTHVHFGLNVGNGIRSEEPETASRAALFGGVTTVIDFADHLPEGVKAGLEQRAREMENKMFTDYSLHATVTHWYEGLREELEELVERGFPSVKVYTTYRSRGLGINDVDLLKLIRHSSAIGFTVLVHSEQDAVVTSATHDAAKYSCTTPTCYYSSRPNVAEYSEICQLLSFCKEFGFRLHIVHVTCKESIELIKEAKGNGVRVTVETAPHYLLFTRDVYNSAQAYRYLACPPFRDREDIEALWGGLRGGAIDMIASDTCGFTTEQKARGMNDFRQAPMGLFGVELAFSLLFTFGVRQGRIDFETVIDKMCITPARLFGLYKQKGGIAPGLDADLAVFDLNKSFRVDRTSVAARSDIGIFEGMVLWGKIVHVLRRGEFMIREASWVETASSGVLVRRSAKSRSAQSF